MYRVHDQTDWPLFLQPFSHINPLMQVRIYVFSTSTRRIKFRKTTFISEIKLLPTIDECRR